MRVATTEDPLPRLIYVTALELQARADRMLAPFGLTLEQFRPLKFLQEAGGTVGQRRLCELAGKTPANMTRILDRLVAKELVLRQPDPDDRRAFLVTITPVGDRLVTQVLDIFTAYTQRVLAGVSPADEAACRRVLEQISANLADLDKT